ncbi:MAG: ATP-binding protein [Pseudonocardiaceae bacterium]
MTLVTEVAALEPVRIEHLHRHDHTVLRLMGDLRRDTVAGVGRAITTALLDAGSVLVDLGGMQIEQASRSLVFTAALDQAGGWPRARLVLYGGTPVWVRALDCFGITKTVPYAPTLPEALNTIARRPPRVRCGVTLEPQPDAPGRARALLHEAGATWGIPAPNAGKARVVLGELVAGAVERAETCHAVVEFDGTRVWVSVSDRCAGIPRVRPRNLWAGGQGQRDAVALADKWGVEYLRHTHKVWAVIAGDSPHSAGSAG